MTSAVQAENTTEFSGGDGTPANPYLISNKEDLENVRKYRQAYFKMEEDIFFTESDFAENGDFYNGGRGWEPIGTDSAIPFLRVFDGAGHTIEGLYINSGNAYSGLFGYNTGTVKNLRLSDSSVKSDY